MKRYLTSGMVLGLLFAGTAWGLGQGTEDKICCGNKIECDALMKAKASKDCRDKFPNPNNDAAIEAKFNDCVTKATSTGTSSRAE
jgi:hypothetical protein